MKRWRWYGIYVSLVILLSIGWQTCWAEDYEYIDISKPFLRKVPLAVPMFKNISGDPKEVQLSRLASDFLSEMLDFTGYFKLLDRDAFLYDPQQDGVITPNINFQNWTVIGAELLKPLPFSMAYGAMTHMLPEHPFVWFQRITHKRRSETSALESLDLVTIVYSWVLSAGDFQYRRHDVDQIASVMIDLALLLFDGTGPMGDQWGGYAALIDPDLE